MGDCNLPNPSLGFDSPENRTCPAGGVLSPWDGSSFAPLKGEPMDKTGMLLLREYVAVKKLEEKMRPKVVKVLEAHKDKMILVNVDGCMHKICESANAGHVLVDEVKIVGDHP